MKRAFTLIELLVVIAIIAILAAILFPVFAQAKEAAKKTQYISNMKQSGTATQIYLSDSDDQFPHAYMVRDTGTWATGIVTPVPANSVLTPPWDNPIRVANSQVFWANSLQPYTKNYQMMEMPGATKTTVAGEIPNPAVAEVQMGIVMNGYLHTYNATAINNVSVVPVYWHVQKVNFSRRGFTTPALNCPGGTPGNTPSCYFNPGGVPSPGSGTTTSGNFIIDTVNTAWQYGGRRAVISRADTSTKSVPVGTAVAPNFVGWTGKLTDPYANVTATGVPNGLWSCDSTFISQTTGQNYWCFFRPDRIE